jgi:hypothetical protein
MTCTVVEDGIAQSVQRRAKGWETGLQFPAEARYFSVLNSVQTSYGAYPASFVMDTVRSFPGSKATRA